MQEHLLDAGVPVTLETLYRFVDFMPHYILCSFITKFLIFKFCKTFIHVHYILMPACTDAEPWIFFMSMCIKQHSVITFCRALLPPTQYPVPQVSVVTNTAKPLPRHTVG